MYARSTTAAGRPERLAELITYVREEIEPMVTALDGCLGLSMVVDRGTGHSIVTTSWASREEMEASAERVREPRRRAGDMLGAEPHVDEWEIALMHRIHPTGDGAACRVTWVQLEGDRTAGDASMVENFKQDLLPMIERLDGFCSASLLVDGAAGRACASVAFESREAMERTREESSKIRATGTHLGAMVTDVREYDLVTAHFHVPELV